MNQGKGGTLAYMYCRTPPSPACSIAPSIPWLPPAHVPGLPSAGPPLAARPPSHSLYAVGHAPERAKIKRKRKICTGDEILLHRIMEEEPLGKESPPHYLALLCSFFIAHVCHHQIHFTQLCACAIRWQSHGGQCLSSKRPCHAHGQACQQNRHPRALQIRTHIAVHSHIRSSAHKYTQIHIPVQCTRTHNR